MEMVFALLIALIDCIINRYLFTIVSSGIIVEKQIM